MYHKTNVIQQKNQEHSLLLYIVTRYSYPFTIFIHTLTFSLYIKVWFPLILSDSHFPSRMYYMSINYTWIHVAMFNAYFGMMKKLWLLFSGGLSGYLENDRFMILCRERITQKKPENVFRFSFYSCKSHSSMCTVYTCNLWLLVCVVCVCLVS